MKKLLLAIASVIAGYAGYKGYKTLKKVEKEPTHSKNHKIINIEDNNYILKYSFSSNDVDFNIILYNDDVNDYMGNAVVEVDKTENFDERIIGIIIQKDNDSRVFTLDRANGTICLNNDERILLTREIYASEYEDFFDNIQAIERELCVMYNDVPYFSNLEYVLSSEPELCNYLS